MITKNKWLKELFEFDYCAKCHGDEKDHDVIVDILGLYFARCKDNTKCHIEDCDIH